MYPEILVVPMREELTSIGVKELRTPEEVDRALTSQNGTTMVVVNSICGCAAGRMRPAVRAPCNTRCVPKRFLVCSPDKTARPPNAPAPIYRVSAVFAFSGAPARREVGPHVQRSDIEHREAADIAAELRRVFDQHLTPAATE